MFVCCMFVQQSKEANGITKSAKKPEKKLLFNDRVSCLSMENIDFGNGSLSII